MKENSARFRVRAGDREIEYEGPLGSVEARYAVAVAMLESGGTGEGKRKILSGKDGGRGGTRSSVIADAVDSLIGEGWFGSRHSRDSTVEELKNRRVPGTGKKNVAVALDRRVRAGKLKSIKDDGDWVYWTE